MTPVFKGICYDTIYDFLLVLDLMKYLLYLWEISN